MGEVGTGPRWRDALLLTAVAIVLVAGLIHYGMELSQERADSRAQETSRTPTARATAELENAPATSAARPAQTAQSLSTCWDGRQTKSLALCGLPDGARGLSWVFPSLALDQERCHPAQQEPAYAVVVSIECFEQVMGSPVTVTYDQVTDVGQVEEWFEDSFGIGHRIEMPGALGGRCVFKDGVGTPARISGMYERFPYVVSVFAPSRVVAERAWQRLVDTRSARLLRGVRGA